MKRRALIGLAVGLAQTSCVHRTPDPSSAGGEHTGAPARTSRGSAPEATDAPAEALPPELTLASEPDLEPSRRQIQPQIERFRRSVWGAVLAPRGDASVVFGFGKAWLLRGRKTQRRIRRAAYAGSFSPDGRAVGLVGEREFLVFATDGGTILARFPFASGTGGSPETKAIRLPDRDTAIYFDGCRLHRVAIGEEPTALGPEVCGRPYPSDDGSRWLVWSQTEDGAVTVERIDTDTGSSSQILGGRGEGPGLTAFATSPSARAMCYSRHRDHSDLRCRDLEKGSEYTLSESATDGRPVFLSDALVVFAAGPLRTDRPLYAADLGAAALRRIGTIGSQDEWLHALSPERVAVTGGDRILVFDLAAAQRLIVQLKGEWEGFVPSPRSDRRFLLGRERKTSRDLFWIDLGR